jgi:hypothetical protein
MQNGLKHGEALSPLLFNSSFEHVTRNDQENKKGVELLY